MRTLHLLRQTELAGGRGLRKGKRAVHLSVGQSAFLADYGVERTRTTCHPAPPTCSTQEWQIAQSTKPRRELVRFAVLLLNERTQRRHKREQRALVPKRERERERRRRRGTCPLRMLAQSFTSDGGTEPKRGGTTIAPHNDCTAPSLGPWSSCSRW